MDDSCRLEVIETDVLIIGAGISGVGAARHLQRSCPDRSFIILEAKNTFGGTWATHSYPGIRSDSDLYTFGYKDKPWWGKPIADAPAIRQYMSEVIDDGDLKKFIRYEHRVEKASWRSDLQRWQVTVRAGDQLLLFQSSFLWMCQGYYNHDEGFTPDFPGRQDFKGPVIHPQHWPDDLDYAGKKVVVIGSGATAATLIPAMAEAVDHITMLQRSPTYFFAAPNYNWLANILEKLHFPKSWIHALVRRQILFMGKLMHRWAKTRPDYIKKQLLKGVREHLGDDFDVQKHFTPAYRPWQQRIAFIPDGDLFKAIKKGKASVVTDHIERFTPTGIQLKSGQHLEADIIITATGLNMQFLSNIPFDIDGVAITMSDRVAYRGLMLSGVPNMAFMFGYLRTSWTMRVDLCCTFITRLLNHMAQTGKAVATPTLSEAENAAPKELMIREDEFNPGYMKRAIHTFPRQIVDSDAWRVVADYYIEKNTLPNASLTDGVIHYEEPTDVSRQKEKTAA